MIRSALVLLLLVAPIGPLSAQEASLANGAILRGLDKINGNLVDMELQNGEVAALGRITITLNECRYPTGNPSGDAFAHLDIRDSGAEELAFSGWMVASSPALNALDHARYDVWVLRCITPEGEASE